MHIFVINKTISFSLIFFFVGEQLRLWWLMASPTWPLLFLCQFITQILFIFSWCVVIPLNGFRKHAKCMTPNQIWYVALTFSVWMWTTCTTKTWIWSTSVMNLGMCNKFTTGCVSTSGDGLFSFGVMASSFSMHLLFTKNFFTRERWIPWAIMSFGIWFDWRRFPPQVLAAATIWFWWFNF